MENITGFGMTNRLTLPSLDKKIFNTLRNENDDRIYTCNDEYTRHFVRQSIKRGPYSALTQYFKSTVSVEVFILFQKN